MSRIWNKHREDYKRRIIHRYKQRKGCVDCGYKKSGFALEFDHIDRARKTKTVASFYHCAWKRVKEEISKCEIRCANCHAIKTMKNKEHRAVLCQVG